MARHIPPIGVGLWVVFILLAVSVLMAYFAGPLLDQHFGWSDDTTLGAAIGVAGTYFLGGLIGWLVS
jgi:hypothetical protein